MKRWRLQAPVGFVYAVRASRYLTHMRKLKDAAHLARGCDVYAYFNNDAGGHAPRNAVTLRHALEPERPHLRATG